MTHPLPPPVARPVSGPEADLRRRLAATERRVAEWRASASRRAERLHRMNQRAFILRQALRRIVRRAGGWSDPDAGAKSDAIVASDALHAERAAMLRP